MRTILIITGLLLSNLIFGQQKLTDHEMNWPQWRGPYATGVAIGDPPTEWSESKNIKWKIEVPGKGHATHNHPGVEEILYVLSGEGEQDVAGERRKVGPGTLIHIPPDVFHETINTGWEQMKIIAIYAPPGPEAELRAMPECEIIPPGE